MLFPIFTIQCGVLELPLQTTLVNRSPWKEGSSFGFDLTDRPWLVPLLLLLPAPSFFMHHSLGEEYWRITGCTLTTLVNRSPCREGWSFGFDLIDRPWLVPLRYGLGTSYTLTTFECMASGGIWFGSFWGWRLS